MALDAGSWHRAALRPSFNTTGPCVPGEHYMLDPGARLVRVMELVDEGRYFTLHAGRQTGKTTCARWLVDHLNAGDRYRALWVDVETAGEEPDPAKALRTVFSALDFAVQRSLADVAPRPFFTTCRRATPGWRTRSPTRRCAARSRTAQHR